jgi:hypothetical protein
VHEPSPASTIFGSGEYRVATLLAVAQLDADAYADLIVHEQPDGLVSREVPYVVPGRASWAATTSLNRLNPVALEPPGGRAGDSLLIVGVGDANNDGRADIAATRTQYPGPSDAPDRVYVYFGPESWPGGGAVRSPGLTLNLPAPARGLHLEFADINGDERNDILVIDDTSVRVVFGRDAWPSALPLVPDVELTPRVIDIFVRDFTADGADDLVLNVSEYGADVAFLAGRRVWPATLDLLTESTWTYGEGRSRYEVRFVADVNGDGQTDIAIVDGQSQELRVFEGGPRLAAPGVADAPDWIVAGVELTARDTEVGDLMGDAGAEVLANRRAVFLGFRGRSGTYDARTDDPDAIWENMPPGYFRTGDVDGDGRVDALVNFPGAQGQGRAVSAGSIQLFLGPVLPGPAATPTPRPTPTATASPTATDPAPSETPSASTATQTATAAAGRSIFLPAALAKGDWE